MLSLPKQINHMLRHSLAAVLAVARWWVNMSDVEQRQTQQRAFSVAACAAMFVIGGPILGEHAELQRVHEAQRSDEAKLTVHLNETEQRALQFASADAGQGTPWLDRVAFNLEINPSRLEGLKESTFLDRLGDLDPAEFKKAGRSRTELDCLAEAVYYEARSESVRGQYAVAEVVMNRVKDKNFPDTICGVVFEGHFRETGCQFTFTCDGSRLAQPRGESWDRARAIALNVRLGLNKPVTRKATHYHTDYVDPYWSDSLVQTTVIGTHIFYRFPKTSSERAVANAAMAARRQHEATVVAIEAAADAGQTPETAPAVYSVEPADQAAEPVSKSL
jgi:spore germination cell wall hydrolase CwlJ-like protein